MDAIFNKKLTGYSALAATIIAMTDQKSEGQVIYHDLIPDEIMPTFNAVHYLDLNGDSIEDFKFIGQYEHFSFGYNSSDADYFSLYASALNNNFLSPEPRNVFSIIDENVNWLNFFEMRWFWVVHLFNYEFGTTSSDSGGSWWNVPGDKYLGIILNLNDGNHYGWIRITDGSIIKDYAYQSEPDTVIYTGVVNSEDCDTVQVNVTPPGPINVIGSATLSVQGYAGYYFQWLKDGALIPNANSDTLLVTFSGDYRAMILTQGCVDTSDIVTVNILCDTLQVNVTPAGPVEVCNHATLYVDGSDGYLIKWLKDGEQTFGSSASYTATESANYNAVLYTSTCEDTSNTVSVIIHPTPLMPVISQYADTLFSNYSTGNQWYYNGFEIPGAIDSFYLIPQSGYYAVRETDAYGCHSGVNNTTFYWICSDAINQNPIPEIIQSGDTLISNSSVGNQWYFNGLPIPGAVGQFLLPTQDGNYQVQVTYANGCIAISNVFNYPVSLVSDIQRYPDINIYLDNSQLFIQLDPALLGSELFLYDVLGNIKEQINNAQLVTTCNVNGFDAGVYFLLVKKDGEEWVKKVFIH